MKTPQTDRPPAAEDATLFVALELSKKNWRVAFHDPATGKTRRGRVDGGDSDALLALIEGARSKAQAALGRAVKVISCYEAGYDGFWLHRFLQDRGIDNHVVDPASILVDRRHRTVKTDRIDLEKILKALMAYGRGDRSACSMVRVPSAAEEDERRSPRSRKRLKNEQTAHSNAISGLLMTQGIRDYSTDGANWRVRLDRLKTGDGRPLGEGIKAEIRDIVERLHLVEKMLGAADAEQAKRIEQRPESPAASLVKLRAVGVVSATVLGAEVFYRTFRNCREVGGYLGLDDSRWQSGEMDRGQGVSKAGNRRARALMIELAWMWLRWQPDSALSLWYKERVGSAKGRIRRIAIVALARKLAVALWRFVTTGLVPTGAVLKADLRRAKAA